MFCERLPESTVLSVGIFSQHIFSTCISHKKVKILRGSTQTGQSLVRMMKVKFISCKKKLLINYMKNEIIRYKWKYHGMLTGDTIGKIHHYIREAN